MVITQISACLFAVLVAVVSSKSLHLPGVSPSSYNDNDPVKLFVTKLTSIKTQIPYDYYALPYCKPSKAGLQSENIGEVLSGDRIENSVYQLKAKEQKTCQVACAVKLRKEGKDQFVRAIDDAYHVHWIVDNLPVGMSSTNENNEPVFTRGFPVGFSSSVVTGSKTKINHYLNNHIRIIVQYHEETETLEEIISDKTVTTSQVVMRIVGFRVEPISKHHQYDGEFTAGSTKLKSCASGETITNEPATYQSIDKADTVVFTYDVMWEQSNKEWVDRWDAYLYANSPNDRVHWFSITNSFLVVIFLSILIGIILIRNLRKDIAMYNDQQSKEEQQEETGWKQCHGDVFRPPTFAPILFSCFVGTGVQLGFMAVATLTFAILGLLSPANRGSLTTALIMLFVFMGSFAGYYSSVTYKMFGGSDFKANTLFVAFLYPGCVFAIFFVLNIALWAEGSSGAIPFSTLFTLLFLWFCVSVPLVFIGSFFGYKKPIEQPPVRVKTFPRQIPPQPWYFNHVVTSIFAGILPFAAVSVELFFIMSALWLHQIYFIFGFLFLVMIVLVVTCGEISILLCYFHLCNEDYRWWWRSFLSGGSCAGYMLVYSIWYNITELDMTSFVSILLYIGYMSIMSLTFFIVTGTIGYFACYWFVWKIYGSIKVD
jgi:transmembrane 9 superfamily protein 2/4